MNRKQGTENMNEGVELWNEAIDLIPGGSQLLSKRAEMFAPGQWPTYYESADGVNVVGVDGNEYTDMSIMGVGSCILGYSDEDVDRRVHETVDKGVMSTLNAPEEVELANTLIDMHPWAERVRYARTGGEAMSIAVRLARAYSGNDTVAFCGYHGWHDWYLATNISEEDGLEEHLLPGLDPKGVPDGLAGTAVPFEYNDLEELKKIASDNDLGAVVLEPIRYKEPDDGFLEGVREIASDHDAPLIFDEITSGFRRELGGVHLDMQVNPNVCVYGKAIGNGYAMAAILGEKPVMDEAQESFVSSTFWTERIGPSAAIETINKFREENVPQHLNTVGEKIMDGWDRIADENGLNLKIKSTGMPPLATFKLDYGEETQVLHTLFTQEMLKRGYLAGTSVYVSYSHTEDEVQGYLGAVDEVFGDISECIEDGSYRESLEGNVKHTKFERLN